MRLAHVPPNWFAAVMGTGIIAIAAHGLPSQPIGIGVVAQVFWVMTVALFAVVVGATAAHWIRHPHAARKHHRDRVVAHFYGAVPMAILTVGTGTLVVGSEFVGARVALAVDLVCWSVGTLGGLITATMIPWRHLLTARAVVSEAFGGWLMPVVPPTVSASAAALLVEHVQTSAVRAFLLAAGYLMLLIALAASAPVLIAIWIRLRNNGTGTATMAPTWWIVLGPLGQSVTAAVLLGRAAPLVAPPDLACALHDLGVGYGLTAWVAAVVWIAIAVGITYRATVAGLPFTLSWWAFTFPVGTFVTGSSVLAVALGSSVFGLVAIGSFGVLLAAWFIVALRSIAAVASGSLWPAHPSVGGCPSANPAPSGSVTTASVP